MRTHMLDRIIYSSNFLMLGLVVYTVFIENGFLMRVTESNPVMFKAFVISGLCVSLLKLSGLSERNIKNADPVVIIPGLVVLLYYVYDIGNNLLFV